MADNFNLNPLAAPEEAQANMNLGPSITNNAMAAQSQAQAIAQAQEHYKQSQLQTQQLQSETDTQAYLSAKGLMPKSQALGELSILLDKQETDPAQKASIMSEAEQSFPAELDGAGIWRFWSSLREPKAPAAISEAGQPFAADGTQKDVTGKVFPKGTMIQEKADSEGNQVFVQSAEPASVQAAGMKGAGGANDKVWQNKIVPALDSQRASSRSALGVGSRALALSGRGIALLQQPTVTEQQMQEVTRELDSIVRGAAGTDTGGQQLAYNTIQSATEKMLQYVTGAPENAVPTAIKSFLMDSFQRIIANSKDIVLAEFNFYKAAYPDVIAEHQAAFDQMEQSALNPPTENISKYAQNAPAIEPTTVLGKVGSAIGKGISGIMGGNTPSTPPAAPAVPPSGGTKRPLADILGS
jgi:hypothetical protein